jgi:tetratricopeptide (TPR) repeat protein
MALAYRGLGKTDEAIQAAKKELELFPDNQAAKNLLKHLEQQDETIEFLKSDDAVESLRKELKFSPGNEAVRDLLQELEQPDDAVESLKIELKLHSTEGKQEDLRE